MDESQMSLRGKSGDIVAQAAADRTCFRIKYRGLPTDLLELGAIEPQMIPTDRKRVRRLDSHGDSYHRKMLPNGKLEILRYITDEARARALPGVPAGLNDDLISWLDSHPNELHINRRPHLGKNGAWVTVAGRLELLVSNGLIRVDEDGRETTRKLFGSCGRLINGCRQVNYMEDFVHSPSDEPLLVEKRAPRASLRLVWSNPSLA